MPSPRDQIFALARELGVAADDAMEMWGERAAIREYEGGMERGEAEAAAVRDVRDWYERRSQRMKRETVPPR